MPGTGIVEVDGSYGEGGGQILRTAVVFSVILGRPVRVTNIRAGRDVPGLKQQHVSTLQTLERIFGAELRGCEIGSSEVSFSPGRIRTNELFIDMKTAASITLLLQAAVPAVALSGSQMTLEMAGGTDVPWSPSFDYLARVAKRAYGLLGIDFEVTASRRGYYPRGGGRVTATISPATGVRAVRLLEPDGGPKADLASRCGSLPKHVAERQLDAMARVLSDSGIEVGSRTIDAGESDSPGSSVLASVTAGGRLLGADALGAKGRRAEEVGEDASNRLVAWVKSGAAVDPNLADMIAPLLSLAGGESSVLVPEATLHLETGLQVARLFTGCGFDFSKEGGATLVTVNAPPGSALR